MKAGSELNLEAHQGGSDVRWGFKKPGMRSTRVSGAENVFPVCVCVFFFLYLPTFTVPLNLSHSCQVRYIPYLEHMGFHEANWL